MVNKMTRNSEYHVWAEEDMPEAYEYQGESFRVAVQSCRNPAKQEIEDPNDDSALLYVKSNNACVLAVADGVGGAPLGNQASAIAMRCLQEQLQSADVTQDLRPFILDAIECANQEILDCQSGSATTLTVAEIRDGTARVYQVGDSMAVIYGARGAVKFRSTCHSPVGYAVESGFMDDRDAMHHDERHFVSNLVGSHSMSIEVGPAIRLAKRDAILLGSDGLFDNLGLDEVVANARRGSVTQRVKRLIDHSRNRMAGSDLDQPCKPDDLTVMLWLQNATGG